MEGNQQPPLKHVILSSILSSDSYIKNMFYTLARKALRKINVFIELDSKMKNRKAKVFKLNFVFKLANLA